MISEGCAPIDTFIKVNGKRLSEKDLNAGVHKRVMSVMTSLNEYYSQQVSEDSLSEMIN